MKLPNLFLRVSDLEANSLASFIMSMLSSNDLWMLATAQEFSLVCIMLFLNQVLSRLNVEKLRSHSQEVTGQTSINLSSDCTSEKRALTSVDIFLYPIVATVSVFALVVCRTISSCVLKAVNVGLVVSSG